MSKNLSVYHVSWPAVDCTGSYSNAEIRTRTPRAAAVKAGLDEYPLALLVRQVGKVFVDVVDREGNRSSFLIRHSITAKQVKA